MNIRKAYNETGQLTTYIKCDDCARCQPVVTTEAPHGLVTIQGAIYLGWTEKENGWLCPFHSGND